MKPLFFDTGPIISLTTTNLLHLLGKLKEHYAGNFFITKGVRYELVEKPLETKKFKFEALQVVRTIESGIVEMFDHPQLAKTTEQLLGLANGCFIARGQPITIVQFAEINTLAGALLQGAECVVIDERTTRLLVENPLRLVKMLKSKLHTRIDVDRKKLIEFTKLAQGLKVIRSVELVAVAFELGLLGEFISHIPHPRRTLLESVLWAVKLQGCAVSDHEIEELVKIESKRGAI